jgi:beta-lactam-binding protein with PASTA domain
MMTRPLEHLRSTALTLLNAAVLAGLLLGHAPPVEAQTTNVTASWDADTGANIAGYVLSYGTQTGIYTTRLDVANVTTWQGYLAPGRYYFAVDAYDTSFVSSPNSAEVVFTVAAPPNVSVTAPADQSSVFGVVSIAATATDIVGVTGLQFQIDGAAQGAREVTPPYRLTWNSTGVANGPHTISAVASDAAGLSSTSVVRVTVANTATVPNVVNLTQTSATAALGAAGLTGGVVTTSASATVPAGSVISENPVAGTTVARGSAVALSVSSGVATSTVPNVVNLTQTNATAALVAAGLSAGVVTTSTSATVPAGSVISENPVAGTTVARGSAVALSVSSGVATSTVPNVVNLSQANATTALGGAGLRAGAVTTSVSATVLAGSVISESPVAGATVASGSTVALVVSTGPASNVVSIWSASSTPASTDPNPSALELGLKFRSDVSGKVTGVRFYKSLTSTGKHTGSLWSKAGKRLATATFSGESASGWQTVTFSTPVAITANTIYVVSYHTTVGHFADDLSYFVSTGVDSPPLHALANGVSGANGVYRYGASGFPSSDGVSTNYWVDVLFVAQ